MPSSESITAISGPNGNIDWLNCGITDGGWNPPFVKISDIVTVDLPTAVKEPNSPFKACSAYISIFEKYGDIYNSELSEILNSDGQSNTIVLP